MDTEQLKMILQTLSTMGDAGSTAFIWWLVLDNVLPVVGWLVTFAGLLWLTFSAIRMANVFAKFRELRDALGVGRPGAMLGSEAHETLKKAVELARSSKASK